MALRTVAALVTIGMLAAATSAGVKVTVKTLSYDIAGRTGAALLGGWTSGAPSTASSPAPSPRPAMP